LKAIFIRGNKVAFYKLDPPYIKDGRKIEYVFINSYHNTDKEMERHEDNSLGVVMKEADKNGRGIEPLQDSILEIKGMGSHIKLLETIDYKIEGGNIND
jgi:hypothetical protein